jgi:hypothetical protein
LSLALWLFMAAAEMYRPLHAWLHGGTIPEDDHCAVAMLAHGNVEPVMSDVPVFVPVTWIETAPRIEFSVFETAGEFISPGRGPPVFCIAS